VAFWVRALERSKTWANIVKRAEDWQFSSLWRWHHGVGKGSGVEKGVGKGSRVGKGSASERGSERGRSLISQFCLDVCRFRP